MHAEGDGSASQQSQSHRAALDRYSLNRPQLRRADALRNVPMDVSASAPSSATASREPADPISGGITLTGDTLPQDNIHFLSDDCVPHGGLIAENSPLNFPTRCRKRWLHQALVGLHLFTMY